MNHSNGSRGGIQRLTLVEQLLVRLRQAIASGRFESGAKLPSEADIGAEFGVSRSTVREAINALRHLGDVETINGVGTFVTSEAKSKGVATNRAEVRRARETLEFRFAVELRAAEIVAEEASAATLRRIEAAWRDSLSRSKDAASAKAGDHAQRVYRFHLEIVEAAAIPPLASAYAHMQIEIEDCLRLLLSMGPAEKVDDVHQPLVKALQLHRPAAAAKAVRHTFEEAKSRLKLLLAKT
ncbi:MAG: FadR/GntR family transcriptional regulator [Vicinamibacterales bacterium]